MVPFFIDIAVWLFKQVMLTFIQNEGTAELELHSSAFPRAERGLANLTYVSDETTEEKTRVS